ncbi:MAG: right-handed parallel beta-helix repeat-containing protein [Phycisphaerales bacterium]|jgi:hypothetical protein|nr:right-handed parallel beta-helix repeat-containing protein [Phycisphaerales bacterium]
MKLSIVSIAAAACLIFAASANAAEYYVSQSSGDDSATGLAGKPWKTLKRASAVKCAPGDKILLKCGDTWNEELHPKGEGTAKNPIVISSYGKGSKPVIDRADYNKDLVGIRLDDQGGFKIAGIEFNRCMTGIYGEYTAKCPTKKFVWIEDCYFHDSLKYGNYKTYPKPRNIGLGVCFFSYERKNRIVLTDITIKNCVFRRLASGVWTNSPDNFNKNASNIYNFGNMTFDGCLFEEGYQWQMGLRGVAGGAVRNCVTHDIGRKFRSFNGVAGAMFFRCKDWTFEDSEWGFVSIGLGSGDGEAFDFEGNCDNMTMKNCLFHDTDGPGFLLCCYSSDCHPNKGIVMENCVLNGKAKRPIGLPRCEIVNTTDWTEVTWTKCRFYLSKGEVLMRVMDPEKDKKSKFVGCLVKKLSTACSTPNLAKNARLTTDQNGKRLQLDFAKPVTINEFKIKEDASSSVNRYIIEYWDAKGSRWMSCFNGMGIGAGFVAPIVARTTSKVRLRVITTTRGAAKITALEAYNDTTGSLPITPGGYLIKK